MVPSDVSKSSGSEDPTRSSSRRFEAGSIRAAALEALPDPVFIFTAEGVIVHGNRRAREVTGYAAEELAAMNIAEIVGEGGRLSGRPSEDGRPTVLEQIVATGAARLEVSLLTKSGETIPCAFEVSRIEHAGQRLICGTARDISKRKAREEALRESEAKFRALAEKALVGVAMLREEAYTYVNPAFARITGYAREELVGRSPDMVIHPEDWAEAQEQVRRRIAGEVEEAHYETRIITKSGEVRTVEIRGSRLVYQGEPAIIGMMLDVTERKRAEEALRESEAKFRGLAEESPVGVGVVQDGYYKYVNDALAQIFGYEPSELVDTVPAERLVHPDDRPLQREMIRRRIEGESSSVHYQMRVLTKDERIRHIEVYGRRFTYKGRPAVIGSVVDVTEKRRLQRDVLNMQEEERRRLGQDLHDGVASELFGITMMLGTAARRVGEDHPVYADLKEIRQLVRESGEDVRRLSRGLSPVHLSEAGLSDALERLADNTDGCGFEQSGFEQSDNLPELSDEEETHLYWIAQEAVMNARKYAEAEEIVVRLALSGAELELSVEDDGQGFDMASVKEGGLGLRTMEYRAELLGAKFGIDSAPGEGTRVACRLPV